MSTPKSSACAYTTTRVSVTETLDYGWGCGCSLRLILTHVKADVSSHHWGAFAPEAKGCATHVVFFHPAVYATTRTELLSDCQRLYPLLTVMPTSLVLTRRITRP